MRMLLNVSIPHEPFNTAVKDGTAGQKLGRIVRMIFRRLAWMESGKNGFSDANARVRGNLTRRTYQPAPRDAAAV